MANKPEPKAAPNTKIMVVADNLKQLIPVKQRKKPGRKKGQAKTGGRQKGTPNRATSEKHELLDAFFEEEMEYVYAHRHELTTRERSAMMIHLLPYYVGKKTPVTPGDVTGSSEEEITLDL